MIDVDVTKFCRQRVSDATTILQQLMKMREECLDQTGCSLGLVDYEYYGESDEFHELTDGRMSMDEFFDILLNWRKEYAENLHQMSSM